MANEFNPLGHFRGLSLIQASSKVGGYRNVFVNLVGNHDDLVYPHFGGKVMNPPKGRAKMWAGDLMEYRTNDNGQQPEIYILRTFKVADAVSASTTVYIERNEFAHKPFVGDVLMVAPDVIGGTGTGVTVTAVTATTVTISGNATDVWQLTISAALTITKGAIMVECAEAGSNKEMVVKNINAVFDCDADFAWDENIADVGVTRDAGTGEITAVTDADFYKARYQYTPALGGLMFTAKMSPMPACVLALNTSNVNGWFHIGYTINGSKFSGADLAAQIAALDARVTALEG